MYNETEGDILRLLDGACEGEAQPMSAHTPQTEQTGDTQNEASAAEKPPHEEREEAFRRLMEGEYKDLFAAYFQQTFNRRFKEYKQMGAELEQARAVRTAAVERFGTEDTEALLAAIRAEKEMAPSATDRPCPEPSRLPPPPDANELALAREAACREMLAHIRARGLRPSENGLCAVGSVARGGAVGMTRDEREELAKRAARGEQISL